MSELRGWLLAAIFLIHPSPALGQSASVSRPRLIIVIVVDQLRPDYLTRFRSYFSKGGLNRLLGQGAVFTNASYQHAITFTCPGHAIVLSGSYPDVNGIVANSWYDESTGREEYCAGDPSTSLIGVEGDGRSPRNLTDSTVGDALKRATGAKARVITIAGKDRSAIMLGGHLADAAYWLDDTLMVTSSYYETGLPAWVERFNASGVASAFLGRTWDRLLPESAYAVAGEDDVPSEEDIAGTGRTFPHRPAGDATGRQLLETFSSSPFHNEVLVRFAMRAVVEEKLGLDSTPDLLALGFSANDLIGHEAGPDSHEVMDITVRTDRLLEQLLDFIDHRIRLTKVTVVLTADHGVAPLPELIRQRDPDSPASRFDPDKIAVAAESSLRARYGPIEQPGWVEHQEFPFLYLNRRALAQHRISISEAELVAKAAVERVPQVFQAFTATELASERSSGAQSSAALSFYPGRSGNVFYRLKPYIVPSRGSQGTTHGSAWPYDTHVPLLWYGFGVAPGVYQDSVGVADIGPTLARILNIDAPTGSRGRVLHQLLRPLPAAR